MGRRRVTIDIQRITKDYRQDRTFAVEKIRYSTDSGRVPRRGYVGPGRKRSPDYAQIHVSESGMLTRCSVCNTTVRFEYVPLGHALRT